MNATELIAKLQALVAEYGDYNVMMEGPAPYHAALGVSDIGLHEDGWGSIEDDTYEYAWVFLLEGY
jgi:hypothetical protein